MPAPGWPTTTTFCAADDDLGAPPVAELVDRVDAAGDAHEPPLVGEPGLPVEDQRRGRRAACPVTAMVSARSRGAS